MPGTLFILATPIGNRKDITLRALEVLKSVQMIVAEDTRRTSMLLKYYEIPKVPLMSCHKFSEGRKAERICQLLSEEKDIALVSDSGTPGISDPGQYIVDQARKSGFQISPLPGPSALTAAVSVSGISEKGFVFIGFLGKKRKDVEKAVNLLQQSKLPVFFYDSPKRILKTLNFLKDVYPECRVMICRELTKLHEEIIKGSVEDVFSLLKDRPSIKGEFVVMIQEKV